MKKEDFKVLLCYDYQNGITNEEENIIFATKLELFSIGTISLLEIIQSMKTIDVGMMDTNVKISILEQGSKVQSKRNTRRKTCIFDCSLQLNFSCKRHFVTKILLVA